MADANLYHAALTVHSEFEALRGSDRNYDIPQSLFQALDAMGSVVAESESSLKVPNNPLVDINAGGTMSNAQKALSALSFLVTNPRNECGMDYVGLHYLFLCIDMAMSHAVEQYAMERPVTHQAEHHG